MTIYETMQWLVIGIYVLVAHGSFTNMTLVHKSPSKFSLRSSLTVLSALLIIQSFMYIHLQIEWVIGDIGGQLDDETDFEWLIYDYITGFSMFATTQAIRLFLMWRRTVYHRREEDDRRED